MPRQKAAASNPFFTVAVKEASAYKPNADPQKETPRQKEARLRDDALRAAMDQAATLPSSMVVELTLSEGQKPATMRAAINRLLAKEPRDINWGVRGTAFVFSKGPIPGGRGRKKVR